MFQITTNDHYDLANKVQNTMPNINEGSWSYPCCGRPAKTPENITESVTCPYCVQDYKIYYEGKWVYVKRTHNDMYTIKENSNKYSKELFKSYSSKTKIDKFCKKYHYIEIHPHSSLNWTEMNRYREATTVINRMNNPYFTIDEWNIDIIDNYLKSVGLFDEYLKLERKTNIMAFQLYANKTMELEDKIETLAQNLQQVGVNISNGY